MVIEKFIQYSKTHRLIIIGPYPPPLGGVSVHIQRLVKHLDEKGIDYKLVNLSTITKYGKYLLYFSFLFYFKRSLFYLNTTNRYLILSLLIQPIRHKIIFYDHNFRFAENLSDKWLKIFKKFLHKVNEYWLVNENQFPYYESLQVKLPEKSFVVNPFIPPLLSEEKEILASYEPGLFEFLKSRSPIIIANAYRLVFYRETETYGFDLLIELISKLKETHKKIGLVFALADETYNKDYQEKLKQRMKLLQIEENIYIMGGQRTLWPLFRQADLFIRPTCTDGDPLSIREAHFFKVKTLASDVAKRPDFTTCFISRDLDDLQNKSLALLSQNHK